MGIKTVPQPPSSPDLAPCDFCLFPKLRGCRYETIEEMKEAVTKVIDTLTQADFDGAFQKLLGGYNKYITAGGDCFEGDLSFMCVLSIKVPIGKKSGNLFNDPRIYIYPSSSEHSSTLNLLPKLALCISTSHIYIYIYIYIYNTPVLCIETFSSFQPTKYFLFIIAFCGLFYVLA